jgi:hypothetical protein
MIDPQSYRYFHTVPPFKSRGMHLFPDRGPPVVLSVKKWISIATVLNVDMD